MNGIPITNEMLSKIYEKRLLIFIELQNNEFAQIKLNESQFRSLNKFLETLFKNESTEKNLYKLRVEKNVDNKVFRNLESF